MPHTSTNRSAWQRLKRNKGAMFGLTVICVSVLVAIFCYFVATDRSTNANRMVVEIGGRKPGFSQLFLKIPIKNNAHANLLDQLFYGTADAYQYLPINSYALDGDSIIVQKYIDEGVAEREYFSASKLNAAFPPLTFEISRIHFWLGTDKYGRDILSRLLVG